MNYKQSIQILEKIKSSNKILVNCHRGPDSDSVGSALAFSKVLEKMGKKAIVVCPTNVPEDLNFLGTENIQKVNFSSFDFDKYDLFIVLDSSNYSMVTGENDLLRPNIPMIVIDHHVSNDSFGDINIVDSKMTSTSELIYRIFQDWGISIGPDVAQCLLTGIIGDTGSFQYQTVGAETLRVAADLIEIGADKDEIIKNIYRNIGFKEIKLWGKFIEAMEIDNKFKFVWAAIPYSLYKEYGEPYSAKEDVANLFFPIIKGTNFGLVMVEFEKGLFSISLRSKSNFDVSKIAKELGGGGHKAAAGARLEGYSFNDAVSKVLEAARKYAKKNLSGN